MCDVDRKEKGRQSYAFRFLRIYS